MFELKDLPSYDTLEAFAARYGNPDVQGLQTWLIWASATQEMLSAFEANLARACGLSQSQFFVLLLLKRNPDGLSVGALADGVSVTSQTMTRMIDRMVGAGLCSRDVDPADARARLVKITSAGDDMLGKALPSHYAWVAQLMSHFNEDERRMLNQLMLKLHRAGVLPGIADGTD
ncbi:MarR family winged helix-turn-helix transcriptional regulator [Castellaniella defragrans]|uniref:DNA-binding MarR family transcriptional regulator n=1 Tax=Castellaniella defragrans TaxID=75697 RepID=A0A7W9TLR1_CASDE|nr:MarR family transcriptional regulator [Castellaniella defragrans]KAB0615353.1 MarR family transcriptional regulator [Castellaniella defragrans]MBB6082949.1 DNA-binding MarR family transcriptional regulator [Castellaniella defragrans]